MDTIEDLYQFASLARILIKEGCDVAGVSPVTVARWKRGDFQPHPAKYLAFRDALIDLAHQRGTLPVTDKDKARSLGIKKLIGRMTK